MTLPQYVTLVANGPEFSIHNATCMAEGTSNTQDGDTGSNTDNVYRYTYTQDNLNQLSTETHSIPHNTTQRPHGYLTPELLRRIVVIL